MAVAYSLSPLPAPSSLPEQRFLVYGVRWADYLAIREALDTPGLRMTFYKGALELMSPSRTHEMLKTSIARLVEFYALERDLPLNGYGSTTFRRDAKELGAEPDECYRLGSEMQDGEFPDIVLEVIHLSPLLDKLAVYRGFEVPEVWLFKDGAFEIHRLRDAGPDAEKTYERVARSTFLPELDFTLIARLAVLDDQLQALRELREVLRS